MTDQQLAQASDAEQIGRVETVTGSVTVTRADGTRVELQEGDAVFQGDTLETDGAESIGIVLADNSTFALGEQGKMVLDEMVYDPGAQQGEAVVTLLTGAATFVSGQIAKFGQDSMVVKTPVATIGIRGTKVFLDTDGESIKAVNLPENTLKGQAVGEIVLMDANGQTLGTANTNGAGWSWTPSEQGTPSQVQLSEAQVKALVQKVAAIMPRTLEEKVLHRVNELSEKREVAQEARQEAREAREKAEEEGTREAEELAEIAEKEAEKAEEELAEAEEDVERAIEKAEKVLGFKIEVTPEGLNVDGKKVDTSFYNTPEKAALIDSESTENRPCLRRKGRRARSAQPPIPGLRKKTKKAPPKPAKTRHRKRMSPTSMARISEISKRRPVKRLPTPPMRARRMTGRRVPNPSAATMFSTSMWSSRRKSHRTRLRSGKIPRVVPPTPATGAAPMAASRTTAAAARPRHRASPSTV